MGLLDSLGKFVTIVNGVMERGGRTLRDILYVLWAVLLGVVSIFTGEIVTFVMLGMILLALNNISKHLIDLKALARKDEEK